MLFSFFLLKWDSGLYSNFSMLFLPYYNILRRLGMEVNVTYPECCVRCANLFTSYKPTLQHGQKLIFPRLLSYYFSPGSILPRCMNFYAVKLSFSNKRNIAAAAESHFIKLFCYTCLPTDRHIKDKLSSGSK